MYNKMLNQKMFEKWVKDFRGHEFMKDKNVYDGSYEIYKAIYEQAVNDVKDFISDEFSDLEDKAYNAGYDDGYYDGYNH